jgi:hypothetical protein
MVAMATARLDTQHEDRQSALEQSVRTSRRQDEKTVRVDDEPQPRLFEL